VRAAFLISALSSVLTPSTSKSTAAEKASRSHPKGLAQLPRANTSPLSQAPPLSLHFVAGPKTSERNIVIGDSLPTAAAFTSAATGTSSPYSRSVARDQVLPRTMAMVTASLSSMAPPRPLHLPPLVITSAPFSRRNLTHSAWSTPMAQCGGVQSMSSRSSSVKGSFVRIVSRALELPF
jgi:hypothetical protein